MIAVFARQSDAAQRDDDFINSLSLRLVAQAGPCYGAEGGIKHQQAALFTHEEGPSL